MSWASLPDPDEAAALRAGLAAHNPTAGPNHLLMHAATRALLLRAAPLPAQQTTAILQFWDQAEPPADVLACMESWRAAGAALVRFSDPAADAWLATHFGPELQAAYRHCHHPAMRSDLFRLAWLLREGGLYVDADDAFGGDGPLPGFEAGAVLLPLAQDDHAIVPVEAGLRALSPTHYVGFFVNNAPLYARAGHPLLARALEGALAHLRRAMAEGVRGDIHVHTGPSNLNVALLDHLAACHRSGQDPDVHIRLDWPWLQPFLPMEYKQGARNWRSGAIIT